MTKFDTQDLCGRLDETRGFNMQTCSGLPFWPGDPRPEDVRSYDIIGSLCRICRYNGHLRHDIATYTVGQHSLMVYRKVAIAEPRKYLLHLVALLHDAPEYIYGDMIKPQKILYPNRKEIEHRGEIAIAAAYDFDVTLFDHPAIKEADYRAFLTEKRDLLEPGPTDFGKAEAEPYSEKIVPAPFFELRDEFTQTFNELLMRSGR